MKVMVFAEDAMRQRLKKIAHELGCEVLDKSDESNLKSLRPHLVFAQARFLHLATLCQEMKLLSNPPALILIGTEEECTIDSFRLGACDFLVQPVSVDDVKTALTKAANLNAVQADNLAKPTQKQARQYIAARTHRGVELMPLSQVYYFAADQKYVKVRHKDGVMLIDETLKDLEEEFEGFLFRIHRNALVNLAYLDVLEAPVSGQYRVRFRGLDDVLYVSRRHLPALREKISRI